MTEKRERRRAETAVRITYRAKERLRAEAERRGMSMADTIEALLPSQRYPISECRNCHKIIRSPMTRHRLHDRACVFWADKLPRDGGK